MPLVGQLLPPSHTKPFASMWMPCSRSGHSYPLPAPPHALMNLPDESNTITGGAAIEACSGGSVRGRWRSHTLSCASIAKLEGSPSFHFSGTFGQAGSTSKIGRLRGCELCAARGDPMNHWSAAAATIARNPTFALCPLTFALGIAPLLRLVEDTLEDACLVILLVTSW